MDGAGDQLLAGAGLAEHQHRAVPLADPAHLVEHPAHRRRVAHHHVLEAVLAAHLAAQLVALVGHLAAVLEVDHQAHRLRQQVGDDLHEARAFGQQLVAQLRLGDQHPDGVALVALDRHADERQLEVVQRQAVEKARLAGDAAEHHAVAVLEDVADHPLADAVAHALAGAHHGFRVGVHGADLQGAVLRVADRHQAVLQAEVVVQHGEDLREDLLDLLHPAEGARDARHGLQLVVVQLGPGRRGGLGKRHIHR